MSEWTFSPSQWVPFRDREVLERVRSIKREDIDKHPNPDFKIHVMEATDIEMAFIADMFWRIKMSDEKDERVVLILPNPCPTYRHVARLINQFGVNCRNVWAFAMDEYANEDGQIAPESYPQGFKRALKHFYYSQIEPELRPPEEQVIGPTDENIDSYTDIILEMGGADICYSGPGWTGHLAFIEPDAPEFEGDLEAWKEMGARVCTLSPFTVAQNSLHGSFGMCGDLGFVPPKAATIGPKDVIASKNRMDFSSITLQGTSTSFQRFVTRLILHGPVTPRVPTSIHQLLRTDCYVSECNAMDIEPDWDVAY